MEGFVLNMCGYIYVYVCACVCVCVSACMCVCMCVKSATITTNHLVLTVFVCQLSDVLQQFVLITATETIYPFSESSQNYKLSIAPSCT